MNNIRGKISDISKGKRIHAVVVEIINGRVAVSTGGRLYKGLDVIGGPVTIGQKVHLDFSSGTPIVHAYSSNSGTSLVKPATRVITTRIISDEEAQDPTTGLTQEDHTHSESQIIDLVHNAVKIRGIPIDELEAADHMKFLMYDHANQKIVPALVKASQINSESSVEGESLVSTGVGGAAWDEVSGSGEGGEIPPAVKILMNLNFV